MTPDIEQIRAALAAAKPLYNETMVMSDSLADAIDRLIANAPVWLASLCDEIERLRALDHEDTRLLVEALTERDSARAERDAALATVEHRNSELAVTRAENERLRTVTDSIHRDTLAQWAGTQAQLDAALAECKRLGDIATAALSNLDKTFARVISTKDELAAALAECERLRSSVAWNQFKLETWDWALLGTQKERNAWRACADQLAAVLNNDLSDFKGDAAKDIDWAASEALAVYEQLKGQP